jgi:hypothetical protein
MLLVLATVIILFAYDKFSSFDQSNLVFVATMFAFISVLTNAIIIFKIYYADTKTRPWIAKLEHVTTEIAWAINAYKRYVEPAIELLKGFRIFTQTYERVTGQKADLGKYVRQKKGPRPKKRKVKKAKIKVWRRDDIVLDPRDLVRPHQKPR